MNTVAPKLKAVNILKPFFFFLFFSFKQLSCFCVLITVDDSYIVVVKVIFHSEVYIFIRQQ